MEEASCKNGKHEFIIDEQIGVRCKHCHVVDLEIRHVLPAMVSKYSIQVYNMFHKDLIMLARFHKDQIYFPCPTGEDFCRKGIGN